jgi:hypothetical protein
MIVDQQTDAQFAANVLQWQTMDGFDGEYHAEPIR